MRFRGNGRKVAHRRDADRETIISFHSVLAPLAGPRTGWETHTRAASSCLARRHRLAKSDDDAAEATRAKRFCPPDPQSASEQLLHLSFVSQQAPSPSLCYIICGGSRKHAAEDVRLTSHEHLAVSQHCGIDLCALSHASHFWLGALQENI